MQEFKIYTLVSFFSFTLLKHINRVWESLAQSLFLKTKPYERTPKNLQHAYHHSLKCKFPSGKNSYLLFHLLRVNKIKDFRVFYCQVSENICFTLPALDSESKRPEWDSWCPSTFLSHLGGTSSSPQKQTNKIIKNPYQTTTTNTKKPKSPDSKSL